MSEEQEPAAGRLFQEELYGEPFWMLVACSLVNQTHWLQAEPVFHEMRSRWPTPEALVHAAPDELEAVLRPLGLFRRRATTLRALATCWTIRPARTALDVQKLPGCGRYAADSWAIFVEGKRDVKVADGKLLWYLRRYQERQDDSQHAVQDPLPRGPREDS